MEENSNIQHPSSREIPNSKPQNGHSACSGLLDYFTAVWTLKLGASLDVGGWSLELLFPPRFALPITLQPRPD
jgi:hypothetical protein